MKNGLSQGKNNMKYFDLYGTTDMTITKQRYLKIAKTFEEEFGCKNTDFFSSSGRCEIVGNHTDHNHGKVLVASINKDIVCACKRNNDGVINVFSEGFRKISIRINETNVVEEEKNTSTSLVRGIVSRFVQLGYNIGGFDAVTASNIFSGAGVSSSAAFEVLICVILNDYFNNGVIKPFELAQISQYAENVYFGKPCGLLDQCGVAFGGLTFIDFFDINNPKVTSIKPLTLTKKMLIINTGGDHSNLTCAYASISEDMKKIAQHFGKNYLAEVNELEFFRREKEFDKNTREYLRAVHFFEETRRVDHTVDAVNDNDEDMFLMCVANSGNSSRYKLKNCALDNESSSPITDALDKIKIIDNDSFCRVHGGGFRGTILCFVTDNKDILDKIYSHFGENNVTEIQFRNVGTTKIDFDAIFS